MKSVCILTLLWGLSILQVLGQCPNDNTYHETIAAPTVLGGSVSTFLYGGEYSTVIGLVQGRVYRISTCGDNAFDSQITIYEDGTSFLEAFNDDYITCSPQSCIYFEPLVNGSYNIVVDEYDCQDNFANFIEVTVELWDTPKPIVTIPTVVHVVYNNSTENVSNVQIQSQIDVLNEDFGRYNSDFYNAPSRFRGFSKDTRIQFCLASRDEFGNPTTGITRTPTSHGAFTSSSEDVKYSSSGGADAWDRNKYLNLWVCNLSGTLLGYAQFPGSGIAAEDGVVVDYENFGTTGTASAPFDGGRTATHEVGHWLDLYHIWGDDAGACTGTDNVNDTPNQGGETSGCPSGAPVSCSNGGYGGDMFVNYMDYSDDGCMTMFTYWQYRRIDATMTGFRSSLQSSNGCDAPTSVNEHLNLVHTSVFPNPANASASVSIEMPNDQSKGLVFALYDITGKQVLNVSDIRYNQFQISTEEFDSGTYLYTVETKESKVVSSGKLVIQR